MTRVDFYILEDEGIDAAMRFACRLCLKAYQGGHPVHVRAADAEQAKNLDELMAKKSLGTNDKENLGEI